MNKKPETGILHYYQTNNILLDLLHTVAILIVNIFQCTILQIQISNMLIILLFTIQ